VEVVLGAPVGPGIVQDLGTSLLSAAGLVDRVPRESLTRATPCGDWDVLAVINHLAAVTEKFGRFAAGSTGPIRQLRGDLLGDQPARSFRRIIETALGSWRDQPGALGAVCILPFGRFDGATAAGINLFDAVVHRWDIAVGADLDQEMNDELAAVALPVARLLVTDEARRAGHYGPPPASGPDTESGPGAEPGARLLALAGRR
jgi:uncharacterized protein (TIGR03086 family)